MSLKDPLKYWSEQELDNFYEAIRKHGLDYSKIKESVGKNKTESQLRNKVSNTWYKVKSMRNKGEFNDIYKVIREAMNAQTDTSGTADNSCASAKKDHN